MHIGLYFSVCNTPVFLCSQTIQPGYSHRYELCAAEISCLQVLENVFEIIAFCFAFVASLLLVLHNDGWRPEFDLELAIMLSNSAALASRIVYGLITTISGLFTRVCARNVRHETLAQRSLKEGESLCPWPATHGVLNKDGQRNLGALGGDFEARVFRLNHGMLKYYAVPHNFSDSQYEQMPNWDFRGEIDLCHHEVEVYLVMVTNPGSSDGADASHGIVHDCQERRGINLHVYDVETDSKRVYHLIASDEADAERWSESLHRCCGVP